MSKILCKFYVKLIKYLDSQQNRRDRVVQIPIHRSTWLLRRELKVAGCGTATPNDSRIRLDYLYLSSYFVN